MKKLILAVILFAAVSEYKASVSCTQAMVFQSDKADEKVEKLSALLNLSADQKVKYKNLVEKTEKDKADLKVKLKDASEADQKKLKKQFADNYEKDFKAILTTEQWNKFLKEKEKAGKK